MKPKVYLGEAGGSNIYYQGQLNIDGGNQDAGSTTYTATLKTERVYPAGRDALLHFRRVAIRLLRNGSVSFNVKIYVDEEQSQYYDSSDTLVDQVVTFDFTGGGEREDVAEVDMNAVGSQIQVEIIVTSTDLDGPLFIEPIEVHYRTVRPAKSRSAEVT